MPVLDNLQLEINHLQNYVKKYTNGTPSVSWRILKNAKAYTPESKRCLLCLNEKFEIANYHDKNLLNKRAEIIAKCRHRRKHLLLLHNPDDNT